MDPEIYRLFSNAALNKSTLRINNVYRGVPINANGSVLEMHANEIVVGTNSMQIMCARAQRFSFITLDDVSYLAVLNFGEIKSETVIYKDLVPLRRPYKIRKYVRVAPETPIPLQFSSIKIKSDNDEKPMWVKASMADISIHGIAIYENAVMYKLSPLVIYDPVIIKITIFDPITKSPFNLTIDGEIRNVLGISESKVRLGLETKPDRTSENVLTHYVAQLQKDIIQELKDTLDKELATLV